MEGRYCVLCVCPPLLMVNEAESKNHPWRSTSIMISSTNYRSVDNYTTYRSRTTVLRIFTSLTYATQKQAKKKTAFKTRNPTPP